MRKTWMLLAAVLLAFVPYGQARGGADGAAVYSRCFGCHKSTGVGISGIFPPLATHAAEIAKAPGGGTYLIQVLLFGLGGEIQVEGKTYNGTMPALGGQLKDDEIAAVLNYTLSSWGNDKLLTKGHKEITAAQVKSERGKKLTSDQVYAERQKLKLK